MNTQGHFYNLAKGLDYEMVRPLEFIPSPYDGKLELKFMWSGASTHSEKTSLTGLSTECYFITILFIWPLLQEKVIINQGFWDFEVSYSPDVRLDPPFWGGLDAKLSRPWNMIHYMPCRTPCNIDNPYSITILIRTSISSGMWFGMAPRMDTK